MPELQIDMWLLSVVHLCILLLLLSLAHLSYSSSHLLQYTTSFTLISMVMAVQPLRALTSSWTIFTALFIYSYFSFTVFYYLRWHSVWTTNPHCLSCCMFVPVIIFIYLIQVHESCMWVYHSFFRYPFIAPSKNMGLHRPVHSSPAAEWSTGPTGDQRWRSTHCTLCSSYSSSLNSSSLPEHNFSTTSDWSSTLYPLAILWIIVCT